MTSLGHSCADRSSTASSPVRSDSSISPSCWMCSHPGRLMWPRNELGNDRRWSSPSADRGRLDPAPECTRRLVDRRALACREPRATAEQVDPALGERRRRSRTASAASPPSTARPSPRAGRERVLLHRGVPGAGRGLDLGEAAPAPSAAARPPSRSRRRAWPCARSPRARAGRSRRTPSTPFTRTRMPTPSDGDPVDALHLLVPDGEGLGLVGHDACVGVVGAGRRAASTACFATSSIGLAPLLEGAVRRDRAARLPRRVRRPSRAAAGKRTSGRRSRRDCLGRTRAASRSRPRPTRSRLPTLAAVALGVAAQAVRRPLVIREEAAHHLDRDRAGFGRGQELGGRARSDGSNART